MEHWNSSSSFWSVSLMNHSPQNGCFWHFSQSPAAFSGAYMLLSRTLVWAAKMFQFITYCSVLSLRNMLVLAEWILITWVCDKNGAKRRYLSNLINKVFKTVIKDFWESIIENEFSEVYMKLGAYCLVMLFQRFRAFTLCF